MRFEIAYLPIADKDLARISDALIEYPAKAKRLFQEIDNKIKVLEDMPFLWPEYEPRPEYRKMVLEDHLLFYSVDQSEQKIKVYRILYSKMDIPTHLNSAEVMP